MYVFIFVLVWTQDWDYVTDKHRCKARQTDTCSTNLASSNSSSCRKVRRVSTDQKTDNLSHLTPLSPTCFHPLSLSKFCLKRSQKPYYVWQAAIFSKSSDDATVHHLFKQNSNWNVVNETVCQYVHHKKTHRVICQLLR